VRIALARAALTKLSGRDAQGFGDDLGDVATLAVRALGQARQRLGRQRHGERDFEVAVARYGLRLRLVEEVIEGVGLVVVRGRTSGS
jgi:hypothetical protein